MRITLLFAGAALACAQSADSVVLTVGSEKLTKAQFERILETLPDQQRAAVQTPEGRRQLAERLAELKTLAQEARARKLDQDPAMQTKMALQSEQLLASALFGELAKAGGDEAALKSYYDAHKQDWEEVKAKHILIRMTGSRVAVRSGQKDLSDAEALQKAKDIQAKLVAGAKFEEMAKAESDDVGSGDNGGDLGLFGRGAMVPEFEEAAFKQPVGKVGDPVKSQFGYHLILVEERKAKSFDEVKNDVAQKVGPELGQKGIEALKQKTKVVYDEAYFGKAADAK